MKHPLRVEVEQQIHAPIARVWHAVVRLDEYATWNPFTPEVRDARVGEEPRVGDVFTFVVRWPDGGSFVSPERALAVEPPHGDDVLRATFTYRFAHWMHALYLVRATRTTTLEQRANGPTLYRSCEDMHGLLARFAPIEKVRAGFRAQAHALKAHCET